MSETIELILTLLRPGELHKLYRAILLVDTSTGFGEVRLTIRNSRLIETMTTVTERCKESDGDPL